MSSFPPIESASSIASMPSGTLEKVKRPRAPFRKSNNLGTLQLLFNFLHHVEDVGFEFRGRFDLTENPFEQIDIVLLDEFFKRCHLGVGKRLDMMIGQGAEKNVVFVHAHMVAAEPNPLAGRI